MAGPAVLNAPLRATPKACPVVLLSHGTGGSAVDLGGLGRSLAQQGFTATAAGRHGNMSGEPYRAEGFLCWWERARDLSFLLDHLSREDRFAGHADARQAYVAGFSLGAHTATTLLGAGTDVEHFDAWVADRGLGRGPREFPDLADRLPLLMRTNFVFRSSWSVSRKPIRTIAHARRCSWRRRRR